MRFVAVLLACALGLLSSCSKKQSKEELDAIESHRDVLVNLGDDAPSGFEGYARVLEIVGADEAAKTLARSRWRRYREHGANPESHNL